MSVLVSVVISALFWQLYLLVWLPVLAMGIPLVWLLARRRAWTERPSRYFSGIWVIAWRSPLVQIWGNETDGVIGPQWYRAKHPERSDIESAFRWSALRNPANGFRYLPVLHPIIGPARIRYAGNSDDPSRRGADGRKRIEWSWTWQGIYAGLVWRWQITATHHAQVRMGYKLLPRDRFGVPDADHRSVRCPFGVQVHVWRRS